MAWSPWKAEGSKRSTAKIAATTRIATRVEIRKRRRRRDGCGVHGGCCMQHVPSGIGPSAQGPPADGDRRHSQRSPLRNGVHSVVPPHEPSKFGPFGQGCPKLHARPQT
ncbi:hypothetical protein [Minwuia thermotolerans]|uniref:hypothetical protein n=1 Tax=Minwuia thermotolerans TaxID=2056226 RepID=UPI000F638090|nr:hypothetical protein [Minwuia thermotolerans]